MFEFRRSCAPSLALSGSSSLKSGGTVCFVYRSQSVCHVIISQHDAWNLLDCRRRRGSGLLDLVEQGYCKRS